MSAKSIATVAAGALLGLAGLMPGSAGAAGAPPLLLLFPSDPGSAADMSAMIALRTQLRRDGKLEVISFDPDAPTLARAAADANHPEWLTAPVTTDSERIDIARAAGAAYTAVVFHGSDKNVALSLYQTGPTPRAWSITAGPVRDAAAVLERDAASPSPMAAPPAISAAHPPLMPPSPAPPSLPASAPPAPVPAPSRIAPASPMPAAPPQPQPAPITPAPTVSMSVAPAAAPALPPMTTAPFAPKPAPAAIEPSRAASDLAAVQPLIAKADQDVQSGALADAYALYNEAINGAPLSDVPRLKLAEAYLQGGLPDRALSEARRALEVAPNSASVQEFLAKYDTENGTTAGRVARFQALVDKNPDDAAAHLDLGNAFWSEGDDVHAAAEYEKARDLAADGSLTHQKALAHLAGLRAATGDYAAALDAVKASGDLGYPMVLSVVQNTADNLTADMDTAQDAYAAGKITRADLYGRVQSDETKAQALSSFVGSIKPPAAYGPSHLDRVEAVTLLSQAAAVLADYLETDDSSQRDKAVQLEKDAQTEMLTAHAAEEKLGLWNDETRVGEGSD